MALLLEWANTNVSISTICTILCRVSSLASMSLNCFWIYVCKDWKTWAFSWMYWSRVFNCSSPSYAASRSLLMMSGVKCSDTEK
jgi:hypothetical protein